MHLDFIFICYHASIHTVHIQLSKVLYITLNLLQLILEVFSRIYLFKYVVSDIQIDLT